MSTTSTVDRIRRRLVDYFGSIPKTERSVREEFTGLRHLDDSERIATLLFDIDRFALLATDEALYEVRTALRDLQASGRDLAREYLPRVEEYTRSNRREEEIFDHLIRLGDQLVKIGCHAAAAPIVEILDTLTSTIDDQSRRAQNMLLTATIAHRRQEYDKARELARESFEVYTALGDRTGAASALRCRGGIELEQGRFDEALATLQEADGLFRELGNRSGMAMMAMNIGVIHARQGALKEALEEYRRGLEIVEELGDVTMIARTTMNIGSIHFMRQEFDEALARYNEGLEIFRELDERVQIASTLSNIGNVHFVRDEYETALVLYGEALTLMKEGEERHEEARLLSNMGQCSIFLGRNELAVDYLLRSIRLKREEMSLYSTVRVTSGLAHILLLIAEEGEHLPTSLLTHFPDLAPTDASDRWRRTLRRHARTFAEECLEEAERTEDRIHTFAATILRARLDAADGDQTGGIAAIERLRESSSEEEEQAEEQEEEQAEEQEEEQAECGYWIWKIDPTRVEDRRDAFCRYGALIDQENPDVDIRRHFAELEAAEREGPV